tara:strand:- start:1246 stop:2325 length:1080 start_codon:yes stop_codon:yes gene_type:complete
VVYCADLAYSLGQNPQNDWFANASCQESIPLQFTYLKLLLDIIPFSLFEYDLFEKVWVLFLGITVLGYGYLTKKIFNLKNSYIFIVLFILCSYQGSNIISLQAGNIAVPIYLLVLFGIFLLKSDSYKAFFYPIIAIATFLKFHLALFLLIPFITNKEFKITGYLIFSLTLVFLFFLNYILHGPFISEWLINLKYVDMGLAPIFAEVDILKPLWVSNGEELVSKVQFNALCKVIIFPFFLINLLVFKKYISNKVNSESFFEILLILSALVFVLALPRLKVYDFFIISCLSLKIYLDSVKALVTKDGILRLISISIIATFFFSLIYWRPQWDLTNISYYYVLFIYFSYQAMVIRKIKVKYF